MLRNVYALQYVFSDGETMIVPGVYASEARAQETANELNGSPDHTVRVISMLFWDEE